MNSSNLEILFRYLNILIELKKRFLNSIFAMKIVIAVLSLTLAVTVFVSIHHSFDLPALRISNPELASKMVLSSILLIFALVGLLMPTLSQYEKLKEIELKTK
ncbi:hypothetical protein A7M79_07240 [Acinetobacter baumannii]|uniref:hypothetical protein n=1 Tax=Acinetobacter baumannii TaxID=470 RepID=UPI0008DE4559|nr:hypothetical protein [Acinetobacter baumannii]OIH08601.1 hypothetical protein A7M79_07240 [Acinetobacter baumannii]